MSEESQVFNREFREDIESRKMLRDNSTEYEEDDEDVSLDDY